MLLLGACISKGGEPIQLSESLSIQPFGSVSSRDILAVSSRIKDVYGFKVTVLPSKKLPSETYYSTRNRYRAEKILSWLKPRARTNLILGVTDKDISTTLGKYTDWGIFGLGYMPGKAAVISMFRLHKAGTLSKTERLSRVAIHEVGHNLGLNHCITRFCIMADVKGQIRILDESKGFCKQCKNRLGIVSYRDKRRK